MKKVYFISGLGADKTIFQNLELPGIEQIHLDWIPPLKNENFENYAGRFSILITEVDPIIIGLSFGGMVAIEVAKYISTQKIILISSAKGKKEIPPYFRILKYLPFHKVFSAKNITISNYLLKYIFGVKAKEDTSLLKQIIRNSDTVFDKWAIDRIIHWKNEYTPANLIHIHGTADNLLPYKYVKADHAIKDGAHLMVLTKAKGVSGLLQQLLN